jgi:hypothetical protein
MACSEALSLVDDLGVKMVMVSSDCLKIVNMIKSKNLCSYEVILTELEIRQVLSLCHITSPREQKGRRRSGPLASLPQVALGAKIAPASSPPA